MRVPGKRKQLGFTLLELMIAMAVFLVICAAMFELLELSQRNYGNEAQVSGTFQDARLAVDQIVRDFNASGYPGLAMFSTKPTPSKYAVGAVAWDPGYPGGTCTIGTGGGGTCATPGDFDLIVETNTGGGVNWIRYQLQNGTLYRSVAAKTDTNDPVTATSQPAVMVPFISNVVNNPTAAQLADITTAYPNMFPGGAVPIFQYSCDSGTGTVPCSLAPGYSPNGIRDVDITLIVATPVRDTQTQRVKIVELSGRGHRLNPTN